LASGIVALVLLVGTVGVGLVMIAKSEQNNSMETSTESSEPIGPSLMS